MGAGSRRLRWHRVAGRTSRVRWCGDGLRRYWVRSRLAHLPKVCTLYPVVQIAHRFVASRMWFNSRGAGWFRREVLNPAMNQPRCLGQAGGCSGCCCLPGLAVIPVVNIASGAVFLVAVALLNFPFQLVALAGDLVEIIVRELSPLLLDLPLHLLPVSFNPVPVHGHCLRECPIKVETHEA
jgi:hypothetical protein